MFLFPTLSDGFGLTQLEALGHGLPVIASEFCGRVVESGRNGVVLPELTAEAVAACVADLARDRDSLAAMKDASRLPCCCQPAKLETALLSL